MNEREKYFKDTIKFIMGKIEDYEVENIEINETNIKMTIEDKVQKSKDKLFMNKISLSEIYEEISKKTNIKLELQRRQIKMVIFNKIFYSKINQLFEDLLLMEKEFNQKKKIEENHSNDDDLNFSLLGNLDNSFDIDQLPLITDLQSIIVHIFKFLKKFFEQKRTDGINNGYLTIKDYETKSNNQEVGVDLEPTPLYKIFPDSIQFINEMGDKVEIFSKEYLIKSEKEFNSDFFYCLEDNNICDIEIENRFLNFLSYFANSLFIENKIIQDQKQGVLIRHIERDKIYKCANILENQENCMKDICEKIRHQFLIFSDSTIDKPKGVIFYGPPRTGKTFTTKKIIDNLNLFLIYPSLAAADFCHGLQGQSEKMINNIAKRTELLPWQLCVLFIDEIDSLAPSRSGDTTSNSQASIIGQFLAVIDGNKKKENMLIMGTTNRLEKMDDAFVQRMDIKIFLGVPNTIIRKKWILRKMKDFERKKDNLFIMNIDNFNSIIDKWIGMSINFTADAMKKSLNQIFIEFETDESLRKKIIKSNKNDIQYTLMNFISDELEKHCIRDQIKFGKYILPKMITQIPDKFDSDSEYRELQAFLNLILIHEKVSANQISKNITFSKKLSKRILVDLNTPCIDEQIQVEFEQMYNLDELTKSVIRAAKNRKDFEDYLKEFSYESELCKKNFFKLFNDKFPILDNDENYLLRLNKDKYFKDNSANFFASFNDRNVETFQKFGGLKSKSDVFKIFIKMGLNLQVNYILLLDGEYFYNKNLFTEDKMAIEMQQTINEVQKYDKSIIIFDLDSLLEVTKNRSQQKDNLLFSDEFALALDKQDITFTESITRPLLMTIIINFAESFLEIESKHWIIFVSSNAKILMDFKEKTKWPKTESAILNIEKCSEILKERICKNCNLVYTEKENNLGECGKHSSQELYLESAFNFYVSKFNIKFENSDLFMEEDYSKIINELKMPFIFYKEK